jgi:Zn-dependent protease
MSIPHPQQGAFPLFKFKGIQVSLHWSWIFVALWQIQNQRELYHHPAWAVAQYVSLFAIVLLHEFGHAFATRQVGGTSENILLWPFGGIAYVKAPPRPGAHFWSIAAGPLVNLALIPVLWLGFHYGMPEDAGRDALRFARLLQYINLFLLIFNILPIYPMDGGQILHALLWFKLGYPKALLIASGIGLVGGVALMGLAYFYTESLLSALLVGFLLMNCWKSFQLARQILAAQRQVTLDAMAGPTDTF